MRILHHSRGMKIVRGRLQRPRPWLDPVDARGGHGAEADEATMTTIGTIRAVAMAAVASLCVASCKPQLSCRMASGGDWFPVVAVSEVSSAAAAKQGSLACDVVYHIDKRDYVMGGCNREPAGLWPKEDGRLHEGVGRRGLICKE
jgi:hypothetical protein